MARNKNRNHKKSQKNSQTHQQPHDTFIMATFDPETPENTSGGGVGWHHVVIATVIAVLLMLSHRLCQHPSEPLIHAKEACFNPLGYQELLTSLENIPIPSGPEKSTKVKNDKIFYALVRQFEKLVAALPNKEICPQMHEAIQQGSLVVDFFRPKDPETLVSFGKRGNTPVMAVNPVALASLHNNEDMVLQFMIVLHKFFLYYTLAMENPRLYEFLHTERFTSQEDCELYLGLRTVEIADLCAILRSVPYRSPSQADNREMCQNKLPKMAIAYLNDKARYEESFCDMSLIFPRLKFPDH